MGRKRNQGKARRAAKAKAREEEEVDDREEEYNQAMTAGPGQRRQLKAGEEKCRHGHEFASREVLRFTSAFHVSFEKAIESDRNLPLESHFKEAKNAAIMAEFADIWHDVAKMKMAIMSYLRMGTEAILDIKYDCASDFATFVRYFEQYIAVEVKQAQAIIHWPKIDETYRADNHTLVKFFRNRIPCSCLNEKYEEVKSITKMSICYSPQCSIPGRKVERSKTKYCSRCRCATYCSRECQVADWSRHEPVCDDNAVIIAEFEAKRQE